MCLIAFAIGASERCPLVIASNRDEFLDRPTLPLGRWQTDCGQKIISGRDLRAGGTWLGITPLGRVAFLTNVRESEPKMAALSRGELVTRWLESHTDAASFAALLEKDSHHYGGFNLVLGDIQRDEWTWMTNRPSVSLPSLHCQTLAPGIYGLSNAALDTPWPKTLALKTALKVSLQQEAKADLQDDSWQDLLWASLANRLRTPIDGLPMNGTRHAMESALSSAFVEFPEHGYGTRSSTIMVARRLSKPISGKVLRIDMAERTFLHACIDEAPMVSFVSLNI